MKREDFQRMDSKKKAEYINENISEGMSFKDIYDITMNNNEFAKSKETLLNQFRKAGYRVNNGDKDFKISDQQIITSEIQKQNHPLDIKPNGQLEKLLQSSADIMLMLEWWKRINDNPEPLDARLSIEVPDGEDIRKTLRLNNNVWNAWKEFCSQQPGFTEKDLLAKALLYYINMAK